MRTAARALISLYSSYGLLVLANALFTTVISLRADIEGFVMQTIGLLMACYFLGMFVGARFTSGIIERAGHIRAFGAFASFISISPLMHILWIDPWVWGVLRLMDGFCLAGLFIITESWLNARSSNETRGSIMALYMVVNYLASGLGQLLLIFAEPGDFQLFAIASICFSLSLLPLLMTRTEAPAPQPVKGFTVKPLLKVAPTGLFGAVCSGSVNAAFFSMAPIFAQGMGMSVRDISFFMMAGVFSGLVLQIPIGKLSDRIERRKVIAGVSFGALMCSLSMILIVQLGLPIYWLFFNVFAYGSLAFVIYPLSAAHVNDWSDPDQLMQTSSGLLVGYGCGAIFGPMLSAGLMGKFGPSALFIYIAVNLFFMMLFAIYQSRVAGLQREKIEFIPQAAVQFPTEELYHAAQDDADPVPEELYDSGTDEPEEAKPEQAAGDEDNETSGHGVVEEYVTDAPDDMSYEELKKELQEEMHADPVEIQEDADFEEEPSDNEAKEGTDKKEPNKPND
ncbi:MFS transporter [Nitrincola sp. MINF-07-Sa-05]|uniref:MFS transporter n=1 Tax=Nitrincola salilacus TaxID=3400273 RepID=UPI0039185AA0